jgi:fructose-specific PTS system IIA-like component
MLRDLRFPFPLVQGLHARPAGQLQAVAQRFQSAVDFINERNGRAASAKSVLALVGTDTRHKDSCRLVIVGTDEAAAHRALMDFVTVTLPLSDEGQVAETTEQRSRAIIPRSLKAAGLGSYTEGVVTCRGIAKGKIVLVNPLPLPAGLKDEQAAPPDVERAKYERATRSLRREMEERHDQARGVEASVLKAHLAILRDVTLVEKVLDHINGGDTAARAVVAAIEAFSEKLRWAESAYLRERVLDLSDICAQLLEKICGPSAVRAPIVLTEDSVLIAESLSPGQLLGLDFRHLRGLVLGQGGTTSHTVILARARGVPTLTGVPRKPGVWQPGDSAIVDANLGVLIHQPAETVLRYYERELDWQRRIVERQTAFRSREATTADGRRLEIGANIVSAAEAAEAFACGAEGIGLFRTEMLFLNRPEPPAEEEQYEAYRLVAQAAQGRSVIVRTLDVGGDKPLAYLDAPRENNPYLGFRGVRCYGEQSHLVKSQLRAILRAAPEGELKIMIPMISSLDEVRCCRKLLADAQHELSQAGVPHAQNVAFGIMLEVPSVAFIMDELSAEVDFFSIGTNDLTQYSLAVDRENTKVAALYNAFEPAFLRLMKHIVDGARRNRRWIGVCGELAENPDALPLLVGLGLDEISMAAPHLARTKQQLVRLDSRACETLLTRTLTCRTREEVEQTLRVFTIGTKEPPLLEDELVILDSTSRTREEVIREMCAALQAAGRTERPERVEEAVWQREDTYSTALGHGIAMPHGKTDDIKASSIVIMRLKEPIDWQSSDGQPVDVVILLAGRTSENARTHMNELATFSRLVARSEFRALLRSEKNPATLASAVEKSLEASAR